MSQSRRPAEPVQRQTVGIEALALVSGAAAGRPLWSAGVFSRRLALYDGSFIHYSWTFVRVSNCFLAGEFAYA